MTNANTYIGVDLHKKSCYVTVMDRAGKIAVQKTIPNRKAQLRKFFKNYPGSAVAVESTMNWLPFYETLSSLLINVNLSNPLQTKAIASARIKNDKVDSKILAELLRTNFLPTVYIQPKNIRDLKELVRQRIHFVSMRTRVKNRVHSVLFKTASEHTFSSLFSKKGMSFLKSIRLRRVYREELDQLLETLEHLNVQIQEIEVVIREKAEPDYDCQLLMTIPGISFFSALVIKSEIGDIARFSSASKLCSYAGLIPSTYASADKVRTGRITKRGSRYLRKALVDAVTSNCRSQNRLASFYKKLKKNKGTGKAKVAAARKLCAIIFAMLTDKEPYREFTPLKQR